MLIVSMLLLLYSVHLIGSTRDGAAKRETVSIMRHVLQVSGPEDIYFGYRKWNLFRKDADFFWFCFEPTQCLETLRTFREYDWDPVRIVVETRPKVIGVAFWWAYYESWWPSEEWHVMEDPAVARHYERSPEHQWLYTRKEAPVQ